MARWSLAVVVLVLSTTAAQAKEPNAPSPYVPSEQVACANDLEVATAILMQDAGEPRPDYPLRYGGPLSTGVVILVFGVTSFAVSGLAMLLLAHLRRMAACRGAAAVPVSLLVVERLARPVQRRGGVLAAVGIAGVPMLVMTGLGLVAVISTIVGCVGLRGFCVARSVLRFLDTAHAGVTAVAVGHVVIVRSEHDEIELEVSPRALAAALRHAVPVSMVR